MNRETFEQLVCAWLDEPERDDLRSAIDAAIAATPELGSVRDEWLRFDRLLRSASVSLEPVDWSRFRHHVAEELDSPHADADGLDARLCSLTAVEHRVDWPRLHQRIAQVVTDSCHAPRVIRFPLRRAALGLTLVAAAALVLMLTLPAQRLAAPAGFARVRVSSPANARSEVGPGRACARVTVATLPETGLPTEPPAIAPPGTREPRLAEVFLMIEPARTASPTGGQLTPFGFN